MINRYNKYAKKTTFNKEENEKSSIVHKFLYL
jgi:hypothetical protein